MNSSHMPLFASANQCMIEHLSQALDAKTYCAVHAVTDGNELGSALIIEARAGDVLVLSSSICSDGLTVGTNGLTVGTTRVKTQ
jgi:hypothetical protein